MTYRTSPDHGGAKDNVAAGFRLHSLDGLRGWAALAVVTFHLMIMPLGIYVPLTMSTIPLAFANGELAVTIFFLMSGIALTLPFWQKPVLGTVERLGYARYVRLTLPILFACALANLAVGIFGNSAPVAAAILASPSYHQYGQDVQAWQHIVAYATFLVYVFPYHETPIPFLWTMRTELIGSIAVFLLLLINLRIKRPVLLIGLVFVPLFLMNLFVSSFFLGCLLGYLYHRGVFRKAAADDRWAVLSPILVMLCIFALRIAGMNGVSGIKVNIVAAGLIVAISISSRSIGHFLTTGFSRFLGRISFPLYLTHYVLLVTFLPRTIIALDRNGMLNAATAVAASLTSLALALGLAYCFMPIERLAVTCSRRLADWMLRTRRAILPDKAREPAAPRI